MRLMKRIFMFNPHRLPFILTAETKAMCYVHNSSSEHRAAAASCETWWCNKFRGFGGQSPGCFSFFGRALCRMLFPWHPGSSSINVLQGRVGGTRTNNVCYACWTADINIIVFAFKVMHGPKKSELIFHHLMLQSIVGNSFSYRWIIVKSTNPCYRGKNIFFKHTSCTSSLWMSTYQL